MAPTGQRATFAYVAGPKTEIMTPSGRVTTYLYETIPTGVHLKQVITPLGARATYSYISGTNRVETETSPRGFVTTYVWDGEQRIAVVNALGYRTSFSFNSYNQVEAVTNPLGHTTTNVYDAQQNLRAVVNPLGERTTFGYNAAGMYSRSNPVIVARNCPCARCSIWGHDAATSLGRLVHKWGQVQLAFWESSDDGCPTEWVPDCPGQRVDHSPLLGRPQRGQSRLWKRTRATRQC